MQTVPHHFSLQSMPGGSTRFGVVMATQPFFNVGMFSTPAHHRMTPDMTSNPVSVGFHPSFKMDAEGPLNSIPTYGLLSPAMNPLRAQLNAGSTAMTLDERSAVSVLEDLHLQAQSTSSALATQMTGTPCGSAASPASYNNQRVQVRGRVGWLDRSSVMGWIAEMSG